MEHQREAIPAKSEEDSETTSDHIQEYLTLSKLQALDQMESQIKC